MRIRIKDLDARLRGHDGFFGPSRVVVIGGMVIAAALNACGIGSPPTYSVGGTVTGLSGSGLVLQLNGGSELPITTNGRFEFPPLNDGSGYSVTVKAAPISPYQTCAVTNGRGALDGANVSGVKVTCSPWTKQLGVAGVSTIGVAVTTDPAGNVYVSGYSEGGVDGNTLTGSIDAFLTRFDSLGNRVRTTQMGGKDASVFSMAAAADSDTGVYIVGNTDGALDDNALIGTTDFFLAQYDSAGNRTFAKQMGAEGAATGALSVDVDETGSVYVVGYTGGGLGGGTLTGTMDVFLSKFDESGSEVFTSQLGAVDADTFGSSVAADEYGYVYIAGFTSGDLDGNTLTGSGDAFLAKYDYAGTKILTKQIGATEASTVAYAVATDAGGNVYVVGSTNGSLADNTRIGATDYFLAKYDALGTLLYLKQTGAAGADTEAYSVALDSDGAVYVTGYTEGALDGNARKGERDLFLAKYDPSGENVYTRQAGSTWAAATAYSIAIDHSDNIYIAGETRGGLDGNSPVGTGDFFVVKYDTAGNKQ